MKKRTRAASAAHLRAAAIDLPQVAAALPDAAGVPLRPTDPKVLRIINKLAHAMRMASKAETRVRRASTIARKWQAKVVRLSRALRAHDQKE